MRLQARALYAELAANAKPAGRALYHGSIIGPASLDDWTESVRDARAHAARFRGGRVYELPREHAQGLRIADYLPGDPAARRRWIVLVSPYLVEEHEA